MNETQAVILNIFKTVSGICERHEIPYFAIGGTLIGAVRHGGFIPWDDDIDIAVPVEQFETLIGILRAELPSDLTVRSAFSNRFHYQLFIKVVDERTTFIERSEMGYPEAYKGIFLDIMPMGGLPSGEAERRRLLSRLNRLRFINKINRFPKEKINSLPARVLRPFVRRKDWALYSRRMMALIESCPFGEADLVGYVWSKRLPKLIFSQSWFRDTVFMPFEDTRMRCPAGYHEYLTSMFGDYMTLPAEEDRQSGHTGLIDTKASYRVYQEKRRGKEGSIAEDQNG